MTVSQVKKLNDILTKGNTFYKKSLKEDLEPKHTGKYLVIDVDTAKYWINQSKIKVIQNAKKASGKKTFFITQIGQLN